MYLLLDQKEKQVKKWILTFPSPSSYLFFILFLRHYQALNFIKKPQCYEVLKKSENTNAFFFILKDGAKDNEVHDLNFHTGTTRTGSDIFNKKKWQNTCFQTL